MGLLKLLGLSTKHEGQHSATGQRGAHAKGTKNPRPPRDTKGK